MSCEWNGKLMVLSGSEAPELRLLDSLKSSVEIVVARELESAISAAANAEIVLFWNSPATLLKEVFPYCQQLRWIHSKNAGIEPILFPELVESEVILSNARGVYARSLAEFALAGMMYFAKDFPRMLANKSKRIWEQYAVEELAGKTLGVYGYGEIGRKVAEKAKAFEMRVIAMRRNPEKSVGDPLLDEVLSNCQWNRLFEESDYLVVAAPATAETRGVIGEKELAMMKNSAVVVNIGRGSVFRENELISCLKNQTIRGAVLDVFDVEPLPNESPLWGLSNVFISPHTADQTATWLYEAMELFLENFSRYTDGRDLLNVCDKSLGY